MIINYSPHTHDDYGWTRKSHLLMDPPVWNLGWLSWDFTQGPHPDHNFSVVCYHSANHQLDGGGRVAPGMVPDHKLVRSLMALAPQAMLQRLVRSPAFPKLELYQAYGPGWVSSFMARSMTWQDPRIDHNRDDVRDTSQALALLSRF